MSKLIVNEIEKYDAGQLTITTGTNVSVGSNLTVGGTISGTLSTAAQPNITSVGTLSSLTTSGDVTVGNDIYVSNGNFLKLQRTSGGLYLDVLGNESGTDNVRLLSSGDFKFVNGSVTELVRITNAGNVGIGTSSPVLKLDTVAAETGTYTTSTQQVVARFQNSPADLGSGVNSSFLSLQTTANAGGNNAIARIGVVGESYDSNNGAFVVATRDGSGISEKMRITSTGNVGIGTSSPISINNGLGLTIGNSSTQQQPYLSLSRNRLGGYFAGVQILNEGSVSSYMQEDGDGNLRFGTANTERMRIDSSGNVGIGTSSPTNSILEVRANADSISWGSVATLYGYLSYGTSASFGENVAIMKTPASTGIVFQPAGTERMRITSGGSFLFGTTDINTTSGEGIKLRADLKGLLSIVGTNSLADTFNYYNSTVGNYRFYVNNAGTIYATNTSISAISDVRLKENIQDLTGGLDAVMSLKPKVFDWKAESGNEGKGVRGFIAQEVEEVFPEYVSEYKSDTIPEDGVPYKSVRQDFIPFLVKAIQEQQEIINDLKARIETLENK